MIKSVSFNGRDDIKKITINGGVLFEKSVAPVGDISITITNGVKGNYTIGEIYTTSDGGTQYSASDVTEITTDYVYLTYDAIGNSQDLNCRLIQLDSTNRIIANDYFYRKSTGSTPGHYTYTINYTTGCEKIVVRVYNGNSAECYLSNVVLSKTA